MAHSVTLEIDYDKERAVVYNSKSEKSARARVRRQLKEDGRNYVWCFIDHDNIEEGKHVYEIPDFAKRAFKELL